MSAPAWRARRTRRRLACKPRQYRLRFESGEKRGSAWKGWCPDGPRAERRHLLRPGSVAIARSDGRQRAVGRRQNRHIRLKTAERAVGRCAVITRGYRRRASVEGDARKTRAAADVGPPLARRCRRPMRDCRPDGGDDRSPKSKPRNPSLQTDRHPHTRLPMGLPSIQSPKSAGTVGYHDQRPTQHRGMRVYAPRTARGRSRGDLFQQTASPPHAHAAKPRQHGSGLHLSSVLLRLPRCHAAG